MKKIKTIVILSSLVYSLPVNTQNLTTLSLGRAVNQLSLKSPSAKMINIENKNKILEFDNYKKSFFPSISLSLTPFNYNRSLNLLQDPNTGNYSYVEDNLGNSSIGLSLSQKIGVTDGQLTINTNQNFVTEFSSSRNTFNSVPFSISYSQNLFGGYKKYKFEKTKTYKKNAESEINYCLEILKIQQQVSNYYISAYSNMLKKEMALNNFKQSDTLLTISKIKFENGNITKHDYDLIKIKNTESEYLLKDIKEKYNISLKILLTYLGLPTNNIQEYQLLKPSLNLPFNLSKDLVFLYVNKNNPFELTQEIKKLEIETELFYKKIGNAINPNINLSYGSNQFSDNFLNSYKNPNSRQSVSLTLSIPIFKWGVSKNTLEIAENNYKKDMASLENARAEFNNDLEEKISEYNSAINLFYLSEKEYEIYKEHYKLMEQTFLLNKASIYDLYAIKKEQQNAMQKYINALNDVWNKYFLLRTISLYDFINNQELIPVLIANAKEE